MWRTYRTTNGPDQARTASGTPFGVHLVRVEHESRPNDPCEGAVRCYVRVAHAGAMSPPLARSAIRPCRVATGRGDGRGSAPTPARAATWPRRRGRLSSG